MVARRSMHPQLAGRNLRPRSTSGVKFRIMWPCRKPARHGSGRTPGDDDHVEEERFLRPVRWSHRRNQCLRLWRDRDRQATPGSHRQGIRRPQRHYRRPARGPDRYQQGEQGGYSRPADHPLGRLWLLPSQAEKPGGQPGRIRAPDRGFQGPQYRLFLLQRRRGLRRHLPQGLPAQRVHGLPPAGHSRAQDHRQRPAPHRQLSGLRVGGQVCRHLHPGGGPGRGLHV